MFNVTDETIIGDWPEFVKIALSEEPYISKVILSVFLLIVFVASLIGNILTCVVIYYDKTMHTVTNYYLFNLAISDLLVTFPIILVVYQMLIENSEMLEFNDGIFSCKLFFCIHYMFVALLWNNGILVMTALSIERYIAICHPMTVERTQARKRVSKIIAAIWGVAIMETLPHLWTLDVINTDKSLVCFCVLTSTARIISGTLGVTTFLVPLVIIVFVYTMIAFKVNNNQKYKLKDTVYHNGFKRTNVNKLIALTVSFVVCWLPFFLLKIIVFAFDVQKMTDSFRWFTLVHKIAMFNSWFTTALNPLLFSLMSIKFRKALKMLWERKMKKMNFQTKSRAPSDTKTQRKSTTCYLVE